MTSHDDLIARARAQARVAKYEARPYAARVETFGSGEDADDILIRDLTAALKECRKQLAEAHDALVFVADRGDQLEQSICEDDKQEIAFRELGHFTPAKERARLVADKIKERLNG